MHKYLNVEKTLRLQIDKINKNAERILEKMRQLAQALFRTISIVSKKEGRRDIVFRLYEQTQHSLDSLKKLKSIKLDGI